MKSRQIFCGFIIAVFLSACKIQITVPEGGRVVTKSGAYVCESGETCIVDVDTVFFEEIFKAKPGKGFKFVGWRQKDAAFCWGATGPCPLSTKLFPGTPLMPFLESDDVFFLAPVFGKPNNWIEKADVAYPSAGISSCAIGGRLYAVGLDYRGGQGFQDKVEEYDPETDTWRARASLPERRNWGTAIALGGKCYFIGGGKGGGQPTETTVEEYDPATDSWRSRASQPLSMAFSGAAVVDGKIYVIGGGGSESIIAPFASASAATQIYNPKENKWSLGADMPTARKGVGVAAIDGLIYAVGGTNLDIDPPDSNIVEIYDPKRDKWTEGKSLPVRRSFFSTVVVDGKLYALGGSIGQPGEGTATVYRYNPKTDQWSKRASMSTPRWAFASGVLNGQIYVVGGREFMSSPDLTSTEEYTP